MITVWQLLIALCTIVESYALLEIPLEEWNQSVVRGLTGCSEEWARGNKLQRETISPATLWNLTRQGVGEGRCKAIRKLWWFANMDRCNCGDIQTMPHLLEWPTGPNLHTRCSIPTDRRSTQLCQILEQGNLAHKDKDRIMTTVWQLPNKAAQTTENYVPLPNNGHGMTTPDRAVHKLLSYVPILNKRHSKTTPNSAMSDPTATNDAFLLRRTSGPPQTGRSRRMSDPPEMEWKGLVRPLRCSTVCLPEKKWVRLINQSNGLPRNT